jgi:A/G-specific adenine glycosylase
VLAWYDAHGRSLPWRNPNADPYRVWLSEVMLQQTTVAHAAPYFLAFTRRWPTVADLAAAPEDEIMAAWAGLGYYARARNLLACARRVVGEMDGAFPQSEVGLRTLPGVGAYTAAAIAAIAFGEPANVVDANVERVIARLFAVEAPLPAAKSEFARLAAGLVRPERAGDWAQALMDLGATVCRPAAPLCEACPLAAECRARASGAPEAFPRRAAKVARPRRHGVAFVLTRRGQVALVERPPRGLLGGMLGLPTTPWRAEPWTWAEAAGEAPARARWRPAGAIDHVFTHFSLRLDLYRAEATAGPWRWFPLEEALAATPTLFRKAILRAFGERSQRLPPLHGEGGPPGSREARARGQAPGRVGESET